MSANNAPALSVLDRGDKSNPPVVCLHGFLGSGEDWISVMDSLAEEFYCVAVDLPGHGDSASCEVESIDEAVEAVRGKRYAHS